MPRFSGAYTINTNWVLRGGVGLFYDKPEGNVIFSQTNLPPFVPSVSVENGNLANPLAGAAAAASVLGNISALDPNLDIPRQLQYSVGVQRELPKGHFAEVTYVGNKGRNLIWQPNINIPTFEAELANQQLPAGAAGQYQLPAAVPGLLEHHAAPQRRVLGLQQRAVLSEQAPRGHQVLGQLHARQSHGPRQRQRRQPAGGRRLAPDRQRRLLLFRRTDVVRSPARAAHHPDLHAGLLARAPGPLGSGARRLGDQRQDPLAVRSVSDRRPATR